MTRKDEDSLPEPNKARTRVDKKSILRVACRSSDQRGAEFPEREEREKENDNELKLLLFRLPTRPENKWDTS